MEEEEDSGVRGVGVAADGAGVPRLVRPRILLHLQHRREQPLAAAQRDRLPALEAAGEGLGHVQRHADGPERAPGEAHVAQHAFVPGTCHDGPRAPGEAHVAQHAFVPGTCHEPLLEQSPVDAEVVASFNTGVCSDGERTRAHPSGARVKMSRRDGRGECDFCTGEGVRINRRRRGTKDPLGGPSDTPRERAPAPQSR